MFTNRPAMNQTSPTTVSEERESFADLEKDFYHIRDAVQHRLLTTVNGDLALTDSDKVKQLIEENFNQTLDEENMLFNRSIRTKLLDWVTADIVGYGPIEPLLNDNDITEVMVNGFDEVFVERFGIIEATTVHFEDEQHLRRVIDRIVSPIGRRVDESSPMVDARLPNGYRVNATIPPLSLDGPILTIRKFNVRPYTAQDLIA
ncbi:CpaF family protein, partial [bacterium]|nr:CpaF family protein [bacterium]